MAIFPFVSKKAALKRDGLAIRFASQEHKLDKAFGLLAVRQCLAHATTMGGGWKRDH